MEYRGLDANKGDILSLTDTCLVGSFCGMILAPVMTPVEYIKVRPCPGFEFLVIWHASKSVKYLDPAASRQTYRRPVVRSEIPQPARRDL